MLTGCMVLSCILSWPLTGRQSGWRMVGFLSLIFNKGKVQKTLKGRGGYAILGKGERGERNFLGKEGRKYSLGVPPPSLIDIYDND